MVGDLELASGAFGPHPLDVAWGYEGTWAGLGMGLEGVARSRDIDDGGRTLAQIKPTISDAGLVLASQERYEAYLAGERERLRALTIRAMGVPA